VRKLGNREELQYSFRNFAQGDELALSELLKSNLPSFFRSNFWAWKYKLNPNFDPSLIVVAEKDGEIVGCNHWLLRDLKLSQSLNVKAALGADLLVNPKHRGHGVAKQLVLFLRQNRAFKDKGIVLSYSLAPPLLNKNLYNPVAGYVAPSNSTTTYRKFFNCRELKEKFQLIDDVIQSRVDLKSKLKGLEMHALFRLKGTPTFALHIESERVYLEEGEIEKPDVIIEGSIPLLFSSVVAGNIGARKLVEAWITRKVKIKKGLLKIVKIWRFFQVFQMALSRR
jgi:predicted N-acetyltransferase YhbS